MKSGQEAGAAIVGGLNDEPKGRAGMSKAAEKRDENRTFSGGGNAAGDFRRDFSEKSGILRIFTEKECGCDEKDHP